MVKGRTVGKWEGIWMVGMVVGVYLCGVVVGKEVVDAAAEIGATEAEEKKTSDDDNEIEE